MSRYLGLDIGDKTIGVAVSDPLFLTAQGVTTIERVGIRKDTTKVLEYIKEYEVSGKATINGDDITLNLKINNYLIILKIFNNLYYIQY